MEEFKIPYSKRYLKLKIPKERLIDVLEPDKGNMLIDFKKEILFKLLNPTSSRPLTDLINNNSKIVIIVDDNTRPTPTKDILEPILELLSKEGIPDQNIIIIFALGAHRKLNSKEMISIVGKDIYKRYHCENHDLNNPSKLVNIGKTSFGTPVIINKQVYEADLRILTGLIKPHNQAGYSGGGKSILPGVCGLQTIASNHSCESISNAKSCLGVVEGNPIRQDIEETLYWLGQTFIVNVIMNYLEEPVGIVAGEPIKAHREGVKVLNSLVECNVDKRADICICGTPAPIDINFYQMLNSLSAPYRLENPILNPGGTIIVVGSAKNGISDGDFYEVLKNYENKTLFNKIMLKKSNFKERPALQIYLEGALEYNIIVVSERKNEKTFQDMGIKYYSKIQEAVNYSLRKSPENDNVIVLAYAPYIIAKLI